VGVQVPLGYNDQRNPVIVRGEYQPVAGLFSGIRIRRAHGERRAGLADIAATLTTADVGAGWPGFPRSGTAVGERYRVPAQRAMALAVDRVTRPRAQRGFMVGRQRESGVSVRVRRRAVHGGGRQTGGERTAGDHAGTNWGPRAPPATARPARECTPRTPENVGVKGSSVRIRPARPRKFFAGQRYICQRLSFANADSPISPLISCQRCFCRSMPVWPSRYCHSWRT